MSLIKKIGLLITILFVLFIGYILVFFVSSTDTENVHLEGYVYDEVTKKPLDSVFVEVNNYSYEDEKGNSNFDEYLGFKKIKLITDKNGFYSVVIDKSAYVYIDFKRNSYKMKTEDGRYSNKQMKFETYLKKN